MLLKNKFNLINLNHFVYYINYLILYKNADISFVKQAYIISYFYKTIVL